MGAWPALSEWRNRPTVQSRAGFLLFVSPAEDG